MTTTAETQANERWREIIAGSPEMADAVRLQAAIVAVLFEADGNLRASAPPRAFTSDRVALAEGEGMPAFRAVEGAPPALLLAPAFAALCRVLTPTGGAEAAQHIHEAVSSGRIDFASLLWAVLVRREDAVRAMAAQLDLAADLLWLIAELTVSPFANWLQEEIARAEALRDTWPHGWCPACGSWPALAIEAALAIEDEPARRTAHCSFCARDWTLAALCPYCGDADGWSVLTPVDAAPHRRLAWCRACRGYLKVVVGDAALPFPMVSVEDLATADLDRLAFEVGWARPPLRNQTMGDCGLVT